MAPPTHLMHPNAGVRRGRENAMKSLGMDKHEMGKGSEHDGHGPVTRTEVEKHKDGKAHVIAHHEDGHAAIHQHPHEAAAHEHAKGLMGGHAGGGGMEDHMSEPTEQDGQQPGEEGQEASCPECGGKMEDDGQGGEKCEQCGYEKPDEDGESSHGQAAEALEA